jgi:hypothetical protein
VLRSRTTTLGGGYKVLPGSRVCQFRKEPMNFTFGKYKGTPIETNTDFDYLCMARQHSWENCTLDQRKAIIKRIYELLDEGWKSLENSGLDKKLKEW